MVLFNLMEELEKIGSNIKDFIMTNSTNPLLWIGLFIGGVAIFKAVFHVLDNDK